MTLISSILIGALGGIAAVLLLNAFDNKKHNVKTSEKNLGRIPSRDEAKLSSVVVIKPALFIRTTTDKAIFSKEDSPSITIYKQSEIVEVNTNKESIIFSMINIERIDYDPDKCNVYFEGE